MLNTPRKMSLKKPIILLAVLCMAAVVGFSVFAGLTATDQDSNLILGDSGYSLGESNQVDVAIREEGSLDEDNLVLVLQMSGDEVAQVKMRQSSKVLQEKETQPIGEEENGESAVVEELDQSPYSSTLGESGISPKASAFSLGDSALVSDGIQVEFPVSEPGLYSFDLYDVQGNLIGTKDYAVPFADDLLTMEFIGTNTEYALNVYQYTLEVNYAVQGTANSTEVLTITLPPGGRFQSQPADTSDYTITTSTVNVDPNDYVGLPNSDLAITYLQELEAAGNPVTTQQMNITFREGLQAPFQMTVPVYTYSEPAFTSFYRPLMVRYGTDPDKIPVVFDAKATAVSDAGNLLLAENTILGTSVITTSSAPYVPTYNYLLQVDGMHYPFSNVIIYAKVPDPEYLTYLSGAENWEIVTLPGIEGEFYKITINENYISKMYGSDHLYRSGYYYYTNSDTTPNDIVIYDIETYVSYDWKGEEYGPTLVEKSFRGSTTSTDEIVPLVYSTSTSDSDNYDTKSLGNNVKWYQGLQGYNGAYFQLGWVSTPTQKSNTPSPGITTTIPGGTYEDFYVNLTFPYEVNPNYIEPTVGWPTDDGTTRMMPEVTYYLYGDPTPYTDVIWSLDQYYPVGHFTFPDHDGKHIEKVELQYESITGLSLHVRVDTSDTDVDGNPLPDLAPATIAVDYGTADNTVTLAADDPELMSTQAFLPVSNEYTVYLMQVQDSLKFGGYNDHVRYLGDAIQNEGINTTSTWNFGFSTTVHPMKNYENVKFSVKPVTEEDKKAMSKVYGLQGYMYTSGGYSGSSSFVFPEYKTNLSADTWRNEGTYNPYTNEVTFTLDEGEYVTEIQFTFPVFGDVDLSNTNTSYFHLLLNGTNTYFTGTDHEVAVQDGDTFQLMATATTDTPAQYINGDGSSVTVVNQVIGNIKFNAYRNVTLTKPYYNVSGPSPNLVYQGGQANMTFTLKTATDYPTNSYTPVYIDQFFPNAKRLFYVEMNEGFEPLSVTSGGQALPLVAVKPVQGSNNKLYVYETTSTQVDMTVYVRPDKKPNPGSYTPIFNGYGTSLDPFLETLQPDSGPDAYYTNYPNQIISVADANFTPFPSRWGISTDEVKNQSYTTTTAQIQVNVAALDKVFLQPRVEGIISSDGSFLAYQKDNVGVTAYMKNASTSKIQIYESVFQLPRQGQTTTSGPLSAGDPNQELPNEFSMYLTGPATFNNSLETPVTNIQITYYDASGGEVLVDDTTDEATLRTVTSIKLSFEGFEIGDVRSFEIPLMTDAERENGSLESMHAYVGGSSTYSATATLPTVRVYTEAAPFVYEPYTLKTRVMMDWALNGSYSTATSFPNNGAVPDGLVQTTIYYLDENNQEKEFYTTTDGGLLDILIPDTATQIVSRPVTEYAAKIKPTIQHSTMSGVNTLNDSDFPQDTGSIPINFEDFKTLGSANVYQNYSAAYYTPFVIEAWDLSVIKGSTDSVSYTMTPLWSDLFGDTYPGVPAASIKIQYSQAADTSIATLVNRTSSYANVTGVDLGQTTYDVTVSALMDSTIQSSDTGTITVTPNFLYSGSITKKLQEGSVLLNDFDTFSIETWYEGIVGEPIVIDSLVVDGTINLPQSTFAYDTKSYIREVDKAGYHNLGFEITLDGAAIALTDEGNGLYSFVIPSDNWGYNLEITLTNRNEKVPNGVLSKELEAGSILIDTADRFQFNTWGEQDIAADGTISKTAINNVEVGVDKALNFVFRKGETNYLEEVTLDGYTLSDLVVKYSVTGVNYQELTTSKIGNVYSFEVPEEAGYLQIEVTNKNATSALQVTKVFDGLTANLYPNNEYEITVDVQGSSSATPMFQEDMKIDDILDAGALVQRATYVIKESNLPASMELKNVQILNAAGEVQGVQPVKQADGSYQVTIGSAHDGGTITVMNGMIMGNGLDLSKRIENSDLAKEEFTFTLVGDNGYKAYGKVAANATYASNQSAVQWYSDAGYTKAVNVSTLPIGNYTVTETSTNKNFVLDSYTVDGVKTTGASFDFTSATGGETVIASANNKAKEIGSVRVEKTMDITDFRDVITFVLTHEDTGTVYKGTGQVDASASNYDESAGGLIIDGWYLADGSNTINYQGKLPLGKYTLYEDDTTLVHYDVAGFVAGQSNVSLNGDKTVASFTLTGEQDSTNNYIDNSRTLGAHNELKTGQIKINKELVGGFGTQTSQSFEFELYRWDGSTGVLVDANGTSAGNSVSITLNKPNTTGSAIISDLPYGSYYVLEKDTQDYKLQTGVSTVIDSSVSPVSQANTLVLESSELQFGAKNKIKSAENSLEVYKIAQGADLLGSANANTFEYEIYSVEGTQQTLLLTGSVASDATGIETGAGIQWSTNPAADALGITVVGGTSIVGLPYGTYLATESEVGAEFNAVSVEGSKGFGTPVDTTNIRFAIDATSEALDETSLVFTNKLKEEGEVKVSKVFENNENAFPGTSFEFLLKNDSTGVVYKGSTTETGHVTSWTSVVDTTQVYAYNALPYGSYSLSEASDANYSLVGFEKASDGSTLGSNPSFQLLPSSKVQQINAKNKMKQDASMTISKTFENNYNHDSTAEFRYFVYGPTINNTVPTMPTIVVLNSGNGWSQTLSNLSYGQYQVVEANPGAEYEIVSLSDGTNTATGAGNAGNSNVLSMEVGAKSGQQVNPGVVSVNRVSSSGELVLSKQIEGANTMPESDFVYTITDPLGRSETITLKAGQSVTLSGKLLGNYSISEALNSDYDLLGMEVNTGGRVNTQTVSVGLGNGVLTGRVDSYSSVKKDGNYTIQPILSEDIKEIAKGERYDFKLYESLDGGATWEIIKVGIFQDKVTLKPEESYTYSGLTRGAQYKLVSDRQPSSPYAVKEILAREGTVLEGVNLSEGSATFRPMGTNANGQVDFLMDYKRMDLVIDKFYNDTGAKIEGVQFLLQRKGTDGWNIVKFDQTDAQGQLVLKDLLAGEYRLTEKMGPRNVVVLQSDAWFSIVNNNTTGLLEVKMADRSEVITVEGNVLHVANGFKDRSGGGSSQQDGNPGGFGVAGEGAAGSQNMGTTNEGATGGILSKLPDTGGMPLWYLAILGAGLAALGIIIRLIEKKNRKH